MVLPDRPIRVGALVALALAQAHVTSGTMTDESFSVLVRIPCRHVRHLGQMGVMTRLGCVPLALGSLWALPCGGVAATMDVLRVIFEERT